ncbi:MAG: hypothetical protein QXI71_02185 [Candidatus Bathyarchaeia archaeon]
MAVELMIVTIIALSALEIAHIVALGAWNNETFTSKIGLTGTVIGAFTVVKA